MQVFFFIFIFFSSHSPVDICSTLFEPKGGTNIESLASVGVQIGGFIDERIVTISHIQFNTSIHRIGLKHLITDDLFELRWFDFVMACIEHFELIHPYNAQKIHS